MALALKQDSNISGLSIAEELSIGVLPVTPVWLPLEPNDYSDFGGQITTIARRPINASRQLKKGTVTDLDASGGYTTDITQSNLFDIAQGFMFADRRRKGFVGNAPGITVNTLEVTDNNTITRVGGAISFVTEGFAVGNIVLVQGFVNAVNNGPFLISAVTATSIDVTTLTGAAPALVAEVATATASLEEVGFQFAAGDLDVNTPGGYPRLVTTVKDLTQLGLIPGEWIFIGGDTALQNFATATNKGFARIRSVAANLIVLDKTSATFAAEANATQTVSVFYGAVIKNESNPALIKRRTYQLERTLGAPDDAFPTQIQSEYLIGAVANELEFQINTADKWMAALSFIAIDNEQRTGVVGLKSGTRPALQEGSAFNTSSDVSRINLHVVSATNSNPAPLFAFVTDMTVMVKNNATPNKAVSRLGAFEVTAGSFEVSGSVTAYFADVLAVAAVRNNEDVSVDAHFAKENAGISIDIPLLALGQGQLNVQLDETITLPLDLMAGTGAKIHPSLDHTLLLTFWNYLPNSAQ
jgi:Phage tail tube protein